MKLLGITCGKRHGNNEVLLKEALFAAKSTGDIEINMIRLLDLEIKPCTGCVACVMSLFQGGAGKCVIRDDFPFLDEQIMEADGVIYAAPVFVLGPHGIMKVLADRMGPSHDMYWRMQAREIRQASGKDMAKGPDERSFKKRVGAFISTGGASTPNWLSLGYPLMYLNTLSTQVKVVDILEVHTISQYFNVVLMPDVLERAGHLGRNIAEAMKKPAEQVGWMGDQQGTCPVCHCNLLTVTNQNPVECPICGIRGTLKTDGDKIIVKFSDEEQARSRLTLAGLKEHWDELQANSAMAMQRPDAQEMPTRLEKYKSEEFESIVLSPPQG